MTASQKERLKIEKTLKAGAIVEEQRHMKTHGCTGHNYSPWRFRKARNFKDAWQEWTRECLTCEWTDFTYKDPTEEEETCGECDGDGSYHDASGSKMIRCLNCNGTGEINDTPKTYKVWVHVEEIDEANDSYLEDFEGSRLPISVGEYGTPVEAYELVDEITNKYL